MFLEDIFKGGAEGIFSGVAKVVSTFKADPLEVLRLQSAINQAQLSAQVSLTQAQTKINEIEAASQDKFVSRWRPACGWIGFIGIAYATVFYPLATWVSVNFGISPPPQLDTVILMELVTGMLGLAGMRTYEKLTK